MSWFKVDDGFYDHPKVDALLADEEDGPIAVALWTLAGSWCSRHLTDGHIPAARVRRLGLPNATAAAAALVRAGLWHEDPGGDGYHFHEWHERQPTRDAVIAKREAAASRMRERRAPLVRANTDSTTDERSREHAANTPGTCASTAPEPAEITDPSPTRPDPTRPEREHARAPEAEPREVASRAAGLSAVRGAAIDGQPLHDWLRAGVVRGYESLKKPAPREARDPLWVGWRELEAWVLDKARLTGRDPHDVGRHHVRCFLRSPAAKRKGWPIAFLVANGNEFWTDDLPSEVSA